MVCYPKKLVLPIGLLLICALGFRWLWLGWPIEPVITPDTHTYVDMARGLINGLGFEFDTSGYRTPGYSILITGMFALFGSENLVAIVATQIVLGMVSAGLLLVLTYRMFNSAWLAFVAGIVTALDPAVVQFEVYILTETLSIFLLIATFLLLAKTLTTPPNLGLTALLGALLGYLTLVRPAFLALPFLIVVLAWLAPRISDFREFSYKHLLLLLLVSLILPGLWTARTYTKYHVLSISTATGYFLTEHVGGFLEQISYTTDQERAVQAIYLKYRARKIAETGSHIWTIGYGWREIENFTGLGEHGGTSLATAEMRDVTGLGAGELSNLLARMSLQAIYQRPMAYYHSFKVAWKKFWQPFFWRMPDFMQGAPLLLYQQGFRFFTVFLAGAVVAFTSILIYRRRSPWLREHEFLMIAMLVIILYTAVISTVMLNADNERYRIQVQPLIVVWLVWAAAPWLTSGQQEEL